MPAEDSPERTALENLISSLANNHDSPIFQPHITFGTFPSDLDVSTIESALANVDLRRNIRFADVKTGSTFFQSVFIAVVPNPVLEELLKTVHDTLGLPTKTPEFPHMSLFYGDHRKQEIADELRLSGTVKEVEGGVSVAGIHGLKLAAPWIVLCDGPVSEWQVLRKLSH